MLFYGKIRSRITQQPIFFSSNHYIKLSKDILSVFTHSNKIDNKPLIKVGDSDLLDENLKQYINKLDLKTFEFSPKLNY